MTTPPGEAVASSGGPGASPSQLVGSAFPIGGPVVRIGAAWRELALTRAAELRSMAAVARLHTDEADDVADTLARAILGHLDAAREAAQTGSRRTEQRGVVDRTMSNLDAAELDLLRLAPSSWVRSQMPGIVDRVRRHLDHDDPQRQRIEDLWSVAQQRDFDVVERDTVLAVAGAANAERRRQLDGLRRLRDTLRVPALVLTVAAIALAVVGFAIPDKVPVCFAPRNAVVCPTGETQVPTGISTGGALVGGGLDRAVRETASPYDILFVEMLGVLAAAVAAATTIRGFRRAPGPYDLRLLLAMLKLPTGALTSVLGLTLMRAGFVPGLSALDSSAQILAWAVVLGYSQQVFTRLVDQHAQEAIQGTVDSEQDR